MRTKKQTKKQSIKDWHKADIKAELEKAGWSLRALSFHHGYKHPDTLKRVFQRRWPKGEKLIAEAIGQKPENIWPTRYPDKGNNTTPIKAVA
ncbi:MAG: helix-turn-helix domain-containing protein [Gammaproteobacteria bacterium]|nr:helix-turn-helix domain-containing protein [Gammaproteobacteria bacterium]